MGLGFLSTEGVARENPCRWKLGSRNSFSLKSVVGRKVDLAISEYFPELLGETSGCF